MKPKVLALLISVSKTCSETYIERDLRQLIQIKDLDLFQRFVRLCAGRIGQLFNASNLSNEVGVSVPTIKSWLSIMQTSYVVMLLPPFYENINKRLTKSSKLYFYDVGLATYLLGIENPDQISRDPLRSNSNPTSCLRGQRGNRSSATFTINNSEKKREGTVPSLFGTRR